MSKLLCKMKHGLQKVRESLVLKEVWVLKQPKQEISFSKEEPPQPLLEQIRKGLFPSLLQATQNLKPKKEEAL